MITEWGSIVHMFLHRNCRTVSAKLGFGRLSQNLSANVILMCVGLVRETQIELNIFPQKKKVPYYKYLYLT